MTERITKADKKYAIAKCKACEKEMPGLVERLKRHRKECTAEDDIVEVNPGPSTSALPSAGRSRSRSPIKKGQERSLDKYVIKTSAVTKEALDTQCARAIYATNSSFLAVEHDEFTTFVKMLRPGYRPPSRHQIGGKLLDDMHEALQDTCKSVLKTQVVNMAIDGWSNIHNEPIVCSCVTDKDGRSYLVETIDTSGNPHTWEYLLEITLQAIKKAEDNYDCRVGSFVTDNAYNMAKMRRALMESEVIDHPIIAYGCSSHWVHLLSQDLAITGIKEHIVHICKYFRNTHLPAAWYVGYNVTNSIVKNIV